MKREEKTCLISGVLRDVDHLGLIAGGAPCDEHDGEAEQIAALLAESTEQDADTIAAICAGVFTTAYFPLMVTPTERAVEYYTDMGQRILDAIGRQGGR